MADELDKIKQILGEDKNNITSNANFGATGLNMDQTLNQIKPGTLTYALNAALENFDASSVNYQNGIPYQTRWVLDEYVERDKWEKDQKIYERDGTARSFKGQDEGFCGEGQLGALGFTAAILLGVAIYTFRTRGD